MASPLVKSDRMKRMESKKSHSWLWDSHITPSNSRWLLENLEKMDQHIKRMLKLIEEDADSFAKKAELYFKKRPELVDLVEEFYRMYRSLAERYDHASGELKKKMPSDDLQSQVSDGDPTTPSPDTSQDSELESDESSSVNNYSTAKISGEEQLRRRILELESELNEVKQNLQEKDSQRFQEELIMAAKEDMESLEDSKIQDSITGPEGNLQEQLKSAQMEVSRLQDCITTYEKNLSERDQEIRVLKETIGNANKALSEENELLQAGMTLSTKDRARFEDTLKEMEVVFGTQVTQLNAKIVALGAEMSTKDDHLHQLHLQHVELIVSAEEAWKLGGEMQSRVKELKAEVERKQESILKGEEEKREAIRQLCISIEHYRSGYHELRKAVNMHKRPAVMAGMVSRS